MGDQAIKIGGEPSRRVPKISALHALYIGNFALIIVLGIVGASLSVRDKGEWFICFASHFNILKSSISLVLQGLPYFTIAQKQDRLRFMSVILWSLWQARNRKAWKIFGIATIYLFDDWLMRFTNQCHSEVWGMLNEFASTYENFDAEKVGFINRQTSW